MSSSQKSVIEIILPANLYDIRLLAKVIKSLGTYPKRVAVCSVGHQVNLFYALGSLIIAYGTPVVAQIRSQPPSTIGSIMDKFLPVKT